MKFLFEDLIGPYLKHSNEELGAIARAIRYNITTGPIPPNMGNLISVLSLEAEEVDDLLHSAVFVLTDPGFFVESLQDAVLKNSMPEIKRREIVKKVDRKRYLIKGRKHV